MTKKSFAIIILNLIFLVSFVSYSDTPPTAQNPASPTLATGIPEKSQICATCHGVDGNSTVGLWPKLAGQHENYLIKELMNFKAMDKGGRNDPTMVGMVQNLSEQDIHELAAYYAKQKETPGSAKAELVSLGERIYRGGNLKTGVSACIACHGPTGNGNALANYPKLGGQQAEYTMAELKKFRAGARSNDPNSIMRDIAKRMTDEEIQAVSEYVSGLH